MLYMLLILVCGWLSMMFSTYIDDDSFGLLKSHYLPLLLGFRYPLVTDPIVCCISYF